MKTTGAIHFRPERMHRMVQVHIIHPTVLPTPDGNIMTINIIMTI